jgi:hypothetical protein
MLPSYLGEPRFLIYYILLIQSQNELSQIHDYILQSQHMIHISYYVPNIQSQYLCGEIHNLCNRNHIYKLSKC